MYGDYLGGLVKLLILPGSGSFFQVFVCLYKCGWLSSSFISRGKLLEEEIL
jgi:hypothetical protein